MKVNKALQNRLYHKKKNGHKTRVIWRGEVK